MISYGAVPLHLPSAGEAAYIASRIPIDTAFSFATPRWLGDPLLRTNFNWLLSRPMRLNSLFHPWGASRFGYAFVLADRKMHAAITAQNAAGGALPFKIDDGLGSAVSTPMFMLPPVPLAKINVNPFLPLYLIPLVDERFRWWERAAAISVVEGETTWTELFTAIAAGLSITLTVDPISDDYLKPGVGLAKPYQYLPLLLDLAASSVGQRIVRTFDGNFFSRGATAASALMIAQANLYRKYAGGALSLGGGVDA